MKSCGLEVFNNSVPGELPYKGKNKHTVIVTLLLNISAGHPLGSNMKKPRRQGCPRSDMN